MRNQEHAARYGQLPHYLQGELNLSRRCGGGIQRAGTRSWSPALIENSTVGGWGIEVSSIENVKELRPELDIESLGDPPDIVVLVEREIKVLKTRTSQGVSPGIAEERARIGVSETRDLNVLVRVARVNPSFATRAYATIREIPRIGTVKPEGVAAQNWSKRYACTGLENPPALPP